RITADSITAGWQSLRRTRDPDRCAEPAPQLRLPDTVWWQWPIVAVDVGSVSPRPEHGRSADCVVVVEVGDVTDGAETAIGSGGVAGQVTGERLQPRRTEAFLDQIEERPDEPF